jgi:Flp pilus assembly protein TadG
MGGLMKHHGARGTMTVEAAIVLPLLILLTLALIEYGWMFLKIQQLTHAARTGARLAVTADATTAQVQTAITNLLTTAGLDSSGYTVSINPNDVSAVEVGEQITVGVTVPYANINLTDAPLIAVPTLVGGSVTMAKEGP